MIVDMKDNDDLQMQAYCDSELDLASAIAFERRMVEDPSLRVRYDRLLSLRRSLWALPKTAAPAGLQARVNSALTADRPRQRRWSFQALAASAMLGAIIASSVAFTIGQQYRREDIARQVVASHIRSLLAPQPFDIASSDRHTVKPWFTSRLPESPPVVDLASQGFVLAGGRVDVIGRDPLATIVYRHAAHTVSLTTLPLGHSVSAGTIAGYNVRSWSSSDFTYVAVSDLPPGDLATFERAFSTGS